MSGEHFEYCYVYDGGDCSCGGNTGGRPGPPLSAVDAAEQAAQRASTDAKLWILACERAREERDRYRLAWLSARRRDCVNSNHATEALELKSQEITRLRAELSSRESTSAAPRLEYMGTEEDGGTVFRLAGSSDFVPPRNSPESPRDN